MSAFGLSVPSVVEIAQRLLPAPVEFQADGRKQSRPLQEWVDADRADARRRRETDSDHSIYVRFAAALLERNVTGGSYIKRLEVFARDLGDPRTLTVERAEDMLRQSGYRFPPTGAATLMAVKELLTAPGFSWPGYFAEAEAKWQDGFEDDPLGLKRVKGIGDKVRDFALSEFSDYYCAPDLHACRMMARTGLILHGYRVRAADFSTVDYRFVRAVVQRLARSTGFPDRPGSLSPAHIDRMFWYYGQDRLRCNATPHCADCPANDLCLAGRFRKGVPSIPMSEERDDAT